MELLQDEWEELLENFVTKLLTLELKFQMRKQWHNNHAAQCDEGSGK